ncbi:hypothetical protein Hanom_Chr15g01337011 [Helianthus anomalus]
MISWPLFYVTWGWWIMWYVRELRLMLMRVVLYGAENFYTQMLKSFTFLTLTVNINFCLLCLGGIGMGWACMLCFTSFGWAGLWVGTVCTCWFVWDGHYEGWVGVIRGVWIGNPCRSSGSYLVVCSSLFFWWLLRGHLRRLWVCCVSGIVRHLGVIRSDQLGGSFFRCSPLRTATPMLGTLLGFRNQWSVFYCCLGTGWTVGWVRYYVKTMLCSGVILVITGWVNFAILMLLDLGCRYSLVEGSKSWLHQKSHLGWNRPAAEFWLFDMVVGLLHKIMFQVSGYNHDTTKLFGCICISVAWMSFIKGIKMDTMLDIALSFCRGSFVINIGARLPWSNRVWGDKLGLYASLLELVLFFLDSIRWCWVYGSLGWGYTHRKKAYTHRISGFCKALFFLFGSSGSQYGYSGLLGMGSLGWMGWGYDHSLMLYAWFAFLSRVCCDDLDLDEMGCLDQLKTNMIYFKLKALGWDCKTSDKLNMYDTPGWYYNLIEAYVSSWRNAKRTRHIKVVFIYMFCIIIWHGLYVFNKLEYSFLVWGWLGPNCMWGFCVTKARGPPLQCWFACNVWCVPSWTCGIITTIRSRFICLPRVGCMVSYFWSPKSVLGDDTGGMPPLMV